MDDITKILLYTMLWAVLSFALFYVTLIVKIIFDTLVLKAKCKRERYEQEYERLVKAYEETD